MKRELRQLWVLVRTLMRLDFRSRSPLGKTGGRQKGSLLIGMLFYFVMGSLFGVYTIVPGVAPDVRLALLFTVIGVYLVFAILLEYQQILLSPEDGDILYWRPLSSRVLFAARTLHIFLYVNLLSAAMLLTPCLLVAVRAPGPVIPTGLAFALGGTLNAAWTASAVVLLYTGLLSRLPANRVQDVLVGLQVVLSLVIFVGYQAMGPALEQLMQHGASETWVQFLPGRWFGALPEMVGWGATREALIALGVALLSIALFGTLAARHLAPRYQDEVAIPTATGVTESRGSAPTVGAEGTVDTRPRSWWAGGLGRWALRSDTERTGFDFFLGMLRGDTRLKSSLAPLAMLPLAFVVLGLVRGQFPDPYATDVVTESLKDGAVARGRMMPFMAAWTLVFVGMSIVTSLPISTWWRAGWVFHTSSLQRYEGFARGVAWGALSVLLLPTLLLLLVALWIAWGDPMHVVLHLSIPLGFLCVLLPILVLTQADAPFTRESMRNDRLAQFVQSVLLMVPLFVVGFLHYQLRDNGRILLLVGALLAATGWLVWLVLRKRARASLHEKVFDG